MRLRMRIGRGVAVTSAVVSLAGLAEVIEPQMAAPKYSEPRFPDYLKPPRTVDDVMPAARQIVRNKNGIQGSGMGVLQSGDGVLLVPTIEAEPMILDAIRKALEERGVKVDIKYNHELVGVSREDALALNKQRESYTSEQGYMEAVGWIENQFADPEVPKKWLKERRPELYQMLFPKSREMSPHTKEVWQKLKRDSVGPAIVSYLKQHPGVRGAYWGKGGSTGLRRALNPVPQKFLGILWADNRYEVMSQIGSFPADVWQLTEEKTLEPLAHVDQIHVTDPEGTDISAGLSEVQAQRWARGSYQRGHLYMFPNQATGRFGYSVVDYPAFQKEWLAREPIVKASGVIAGTHNHTGMYPRWEVFFKDGYIVDVKGGGTYGEILREFLHYPGTQELVYPFHDKP